MSQTVNSRVIVPSSLSSARRGRTHHTPAGEPAALFHIINSVTIIGFVGADPEQRQARNKNSGRVPRTNHQPCAVARYPTECGLHTHTNTLTGPQPSAQ